MLIAKLKTGVMITSPSGNEMFYSDSELKKTSGGISKVIDHLSRKKWRNVGGLYQIAKITVDKFPDNSIDWESTFFSIEKADYSNHQLHQENQIQSGSTLGKKKRAADVINKIKKQMIMKKNAEDEIRELVQQRLKDYQIIN